VVGSTCLNGHCEHALGD